MHTGAVFFKTLNPPKEIMRSLLIWTSEDVRQLKPVAGPAASQQVRRRRSSYEAGDVVWREEGLGARAEGRKNTIEAYSKTRLAHNVHLLRVHLGILRAY